MFAEGRGGGLKKKGGEEEEEERKRSRQGEGERTGSDFCRLGTRRRRARRMAALPGTVPRMVRPAPWQNYPRTGFPLEGKSARVASLLRRGLRALGEVAICAGRRRRQHGGRRGAPLPFGSEPRRPTREVSGAPRLSVFAWVSPAGGPSVTGPGFRPFPARLNSEEISSPGQFQVLVDLNSFHSFQILST